MKKRLLSVILAVIMTVGMIVTAIPAVSAAEMNFKDVKTTDWFYEYVKYVFERDLMKGTSSSTFGPDESMTRGQIVTILSRMSGDDVAGMSSEMNFKDVDKAEYYADPIGWAVKNGVAKGMTATTFEPETPVLRQEFAAFFVRYMNYKGITLPDAGEVTPFPDKASFPDWATENIETLRKTGLVKGDAKGNYNPASKMTRAEIATVTMRFTEAIGAQQSLDRPLSEIVTEYLDENLCVAHNKLDLIYGWSSTFTEENIGNLLKKEIGLPDTVEVTFGEELMIAKAEEYSPSGECGCGEGGGSVWIDDIETTFTDTTTGDTYTVSIDFAFRKVSCAEWLGYGTGARSVCHEDWDSEFHDLEDEFWVFQSDDDHNPVDFGGVLTPETLEARAREITGLTDAEKYPFFVFGYEISEVTTGVDLCFGFTDNSGYLPEGWLDLIYVWGYLKGDAPDVTPAFSEAKKEAIDEKLDDILCITHGLIDVQFGPGATLTVENLAAFVSDILELGDGYSV